MCGVPACDPQPKDCDCLNFCQQSVRVCSTQALTDLEITFPCPDGNVYVDETGCPAFDSGPAVGTKPFGCAPYDVGQLMAKNGSAENARYADLGIWTGDPLPSTAVCPTLDKITVCGGSCGGCPNGLVCTGRSPLHPVGFCVPPSPTTNQCNPNDANPLNPRICAIGQGCFTFKVQSEAQAEADRFGMCVPMDECQALAANLPGGGTCTPPQ